MNFESPPVPGCFPLPGIVNKVRQHWYTETRNPTLQFPAPGVSLEIAFYSMPIAPEHVTKLERENAYVHLWAWLLACKETLHDPVNEPLWRESSKRVNMNFNLCTSTNEHISRAYQLKEDEEISADTAGHSVLQRGRALVALQD